MSKSVESLKAILLGGVAFRRQRRISRQLSASEKHVFPLFADREAANAASYTPKIRLSHFFPVRQRVGTGSEVTCRAQGRRS